ncbi:EAL domain-containing protein [Paenibacillus sp. TAB 01]|uniref:EAL domain-containing protein n=1 Tax=Paenibacillus sp. TAB 01 TaxID=3368988 RepID=UPI003753B635
MNEGKVNILLVDDQAENLLALEAVIERDDYNLVKAHSGEEALKYLLKYDFATILLDVQMPGLDGFETARIIKSREKSKNIPIIFVTANYMDEHHVYTGYFIGAIEYILKPFDPNTLKAKVQGFVNIYKTNRKLLQQTEMLMQKTKELEAANKELSEITSELRKSQALTNVISETSIDSMLILNQDGFILKVNPAVHKMFGYENSEIVGRNMDILFPFPQAQRFLPGKWDDALYGAEEGIHEVNAVRKDGSTFPVEFQIGSTFVENKNIIACTIRDVTKKRQSQQLITHMAYHDGLTNLPNRRMFNDRLNLMLNQAKQENQLLVMMYLDLDRFKYINDSLGHLIGDKLLQEVARRLVSCTDNVHFVARIGGDEFNMVLQDTNREDALDIAEDVLEQLKKPFYIEDFELYVTASIGISVYPYDGKDAPALLKNADAALYRAKEQGKNKFQIYHSGMNIRSYRTFMLQNDLRKAMEHGEFTLLYQPRIDVNSGEITCTEAVIRWNHPNWGTLQPSEFLPLAEETGQIAAIGEWVLRTACKQIQLWRMSGLPLPRMAVRFSSLQFLQKQFVRNIEQILKEAGLEPAMLEVEITESAIMRNESVIIRALHELKQLGVTICIEEFGSGGSSLSSLKHIPADLIKIDKLFMDDLAANPAQSTAFISSIVSLARSLNMQAVAVGIESEEQLNLLKNLSIQGVQGRLFSLPVTAAELEPLLSQGLSEQFSFHNRAEKEAEEHDILDFQLYRMKEAFSISSRELEVFKLIIDGLNNREISTQLFISEHTVKNHITRIFQKLNVNDRLQAMAKVYQSCIQTNKAQ